MEFFVFGYFIILLSFIWILYFFRLILKYAYHFHFRKKGQVFFSILSILNCSIEGVCIRLSIPNNDQNQQKEMLLASINSIRIKKRIIIIIIYLFVYTSSIYNNKIQKFDNIFKLLQSSSWILNPILSVSLSLCMFMTGSHANRNSFCILS